MKLKHTVSALLLVLLLGTGAVWSSMATVMSQAASSDVYTDALASGWGDWSYNAARDFASTGTVHGGSVAIEVTYTQGWGGFQIGYGGSYLDIGAYDTFHFWIHGGTAGGQTILLTISLEGEVAVQQTVTPVAGTWTEVSVPLVAYSPRSVYSIDWFNNTGGSQPTFYLDDIAFVNENLPTPTTAPPGAGPDLSVDASADQHSISPYIYGMNFADEDLANAVNLPVRRWGGNSTTRYNWETNVHNTGSDWYYENIPNSTSADDFVAQNDGTGAETLMTMPLLGWVPKVGATSHPYDCGFKVSVYGAQDSVDPWDTDCGNGVQGGTQITGNDPQDTSIAITAAYATEWVQHLVATHGSAAEGGVQFYNLDNEPMLWGSTHRDVHPAGTTAVELRNQTYAYAAAIKAADPAAQTLGPVVWGWCAYFCSGAADDCCSPNPSSTDPDRGRFTEWYLEQMQAYETANGVRILDYVDVHFYPAASGVALSGPGDADTQALRLRSTRSLWDPTYHDESWIEDTTDEPIQMIRRMKQWVAENYPGTKTAITEYNWGALEHINGALAQADVLGIFGREGLDLATLWSPPEVDDPGAFAFRMYRNYDGADATFGDLSVQAASTDQEQLSVYAALRDADGALTLMVINKTAQALTSTLSIANYQSGALAEVYRYSSADLAAIVREDDQALAGSGFTSVFPANSITLFVLRPGSGSVESVSIDGPETGETGTAIRFSAEVSPTNASTPITYTWVPAPYLGQGEPAATYVWSTSGSKTITVTAENEGGIASAAHVISVTEVPFVPLTGVSIQGQGSLIIGNTYVFQAVVAPSNASLPITYTWSPEPTLGQSTDAASYIWGSVGTRVITVTAQNDETVFSATHTVEVGEPVWFLVYLPLVLR